MLSTQALSQPVGPTRYAFRRARLIAALAAVASSIPAIAAQPLTVAAVLRDPLTYNGRHVDVSGTVRGIRAKTSARGNAYETFSLCDGSCLHVFAWGRPTLRAGARATVHGTFAATKRVGNYTFHNEIEADEGSL